MLHKVKSTYREIAKYFPELCHKLSSSEYNKQILFDVAGKGRPRPRQKTALGKRLSEYTCKTSDCYDPKFNCKIRRIRPDWFVPTSVRNKQLLLEMARKGEARPRQTTKLGCALSAYTSDKSLVSDSAFTKKIKKIAPLWFVSNVDKGEQKKQKLIQMAKDGKPRPKDSEKIGALLYYHLKKDSAFKSKIKKLRPDWLVKTSECNKQILLSIAREGKPKPKCPSLLGSALSNYTRKGGIVCDPKFKREIKKLAPHWFKRCSTK